MDTVDLRQHIVTLLQEGHHVTTDQLLGLLNTNPQIQKLRLSKQRLQAIVREMVNGGVIERTNEPPKYEKRYRMPATASPRYRSRSYDNGYEIIKRVTDHGDELVIGKDMSEAEARACVDALNALEAK
jgi:hypothetical protein